jgi:predicted regulator of Ras-like GTPase activity (Roadblock/LC7/MglB family)
MDASAALERLRDISSQVRAAVVFDRAGNVLGSTLANEDRAAAIAREAKELLGAAEARGGGRPADFAQLEVALQGGSVFVVRDEERLVAATTPPEPTVGLVFYDLKSCLRELDEPARPTRGRTAKAEPTKPKAAAKPEKAAKPRSKRPKKDDAQS